MGINYNDDVDLDVDKLPKFKNPQAYCAYYYLKKQIDEMVEYKVRSDEDAKNLYNKLDKKKAIFMK